VAGGAGEPVTDGDPGFLDEAAKANGSGAGAKAEVPKAGVNGKAEDDWTQWLPKDTWPTPLSKDALHGLPGEFIHTVAAHTEADPAALLLQFLCFAGSCCGNRCGITIEATRHCTNLFTIILGDTAKARKGTSIGHVRRVLRLADPRWEETRVTSGLSSGEGLIQWVRDPTVDGDGEIVDAGATDKRLLIIEQELCRPLRVMSRADNTLSAVMRDAWDGNRLGVMTRKNPITATGATISLVAHITIAELRAELTEIHAANGFGNRCLFAAARRSNILPFGGRVGDGEIEKLARDVRSAIDALDDCHIDVGFTDTARKLWIEVYGELSEGRPGIYGAMTARSEAQALRVALIYAILDKRKRIDAEHLRAGLEVVRYSNDSVWHVFGDRTGLRVADTILAGLRSSTNGLTRTEISKLFSRNVDAEQLRNAMGLLLANKLVHNTMQKEKGRPTERWCAL
jgi:hypothetical protein